jgi:SpoVK/Ycf46/Vps4 family AAA+-type ATPase
MQHISPLVDLVQRIEPVATRSDLVLAKQRLRVMDQIALQWRARTQDCLNGISPAKTGGAISALFAGSSGTGKTMAAEILANETRLAFYSIDLGRLVSRYLGETENNLESLFEETQDAGALLFFDEADTLFGKRGEVPDTRERSANMDAEWLLQRVATYCGIVIFATYLKEAMDPAFLRRLRHVVEFPFPDMAQRVEIWQRIFPPDTPVEALDPTRLARLPLSGAAIRDIARSSAELAASEGKPVRMDHLLRAARSECAKIDGKIDVGQIARP